MRFFTQELPSVSDSLWKILFQSTTLSLCTVCCLSKSSRQGQGGHAGDSCGTPPGNADSGNHQAASVLSPLTGSAQLGNSDIHKTIKVGKVFRHYLPVRTKACLAFMWKLKSLCQRMALGAVVEAKDLYKTCDFVLCFYIAAF